MPTPAPPQWEQVARTRNLAAIHPTGYDDVAYTASGEYDARRVVELIDPLLHPVVADFGCGDGRVTEHLAQIYDRVLAVDASMSMLRLTRDRVAAAGRAGRVDIVRSDGTNLATRARRPIDAVVSLATFIHMTSAGGATVLRGLAAAVRPGGLLALQIPLYDEPREPVDWTDVGVWTVPMLERAARDAGLQLTGPLATNDGSFAYDRVGPNHAALHVLRR